MLGLVLSMLTLTLKLLGVRVTLTELTVAMLK